MINFALAITIGVLAILRLTSLSENPPGFFVDESSTAYNAYSILKTGADEHQKPLPVFFEAFGEFKNPIYIYSQVPAVGVFGLNIESARLPSALWGLAAAIFFALLLRELKVGKTAILFSTCVLLAAPWHFILSRIAFEVIVFPTIFFASLFFLLRKNYFIFSILMGLLFYSYTSARVLAPIYFFISFLIFRFKPTNILVFILMLLPAFLWEQAHPGSLGARYETVALMNYSKSIPEFLTKFILNYLSHFSPDFLINRGDGFIRHSLSWHSIFFWTTIPLLIIGLIKTVQNIKLPFNKFLLVALPIAIVPSALTIQSPHILRSIAFPTLSLIVIAIGANFVWQKSKIVFSVLVCLFALEVVGAMSYFQGDYKIVSRPWFDADAVEFIEQTGQLPENPYPGTEETVKFFKEAKF